MSKYPALTDLAIKRLTPGTAPRDIRDGGQRGLILTLQRTGEKVFTVRYRYQGKHRRLVLGVYPELTLAKARDAAGHARDVIKAGGDPAGEIATKKAAPTNTFRQLAADYLEWAEHEKAPHPNTKATIVEKQRMLDIDVFPEWGDRDPATIRRHDVKLLLKPIARRALVQRNRVLMIISPIFKYAVAEEWPGVEFNPTAGIGKLHEGDGRDVVLSANTLRRIWRLLSHHPTTADKPAPGRQRQMGDPDDPLCPISEPLADVFKLRMLTGQRMVEFLRMRVRDVEEGWWNLPGTTTKNHRPHRIPLLPEALAILEPYLAHKASTALVFQGRDGGSLTDRAKKASVEIRRVLGIEFRGTDLRRTMATNMAKAKIPMEHIAHVLNHMDGAPRATHIYNRHDYDDQKRAAFEAWTRVLMTILATKEGDNVLAFMKS